MTFYDYYAEFIAEEEEKVYTKEHIDFFMKSMPVLHEMYYKGYLRECSRSCIIPERIYL